MLHETPFERLFAAARIREHLALSTLDAVSHGLPELDYLPAVRVADALVIAYVEFSEKLQQLSLEHRLRRRGTHTICPDCGNPDCPHADLAIFEGQVLGTAAVKAFYSS